MRYLQFFLLFLIFQNNRGKTHKMWRGRITGFSISIQSLNLSNYQQKTVWPPITNCTLDGKAIFSFFGFIFHICYKQLSILLSVYLVCLTGNHISLSLVALMTQHIELDSDSSCTPHRTARFHLSLHRLQPILCCKGVLNHDKVCSIKHIQKKNISLSMSSKTSLI